MSYIAILTIFCGLLLVVDIPWLHFFVERVSY